MAFCRRRVRGKGQVSVKSHSDLVIDVRGVTLFVKERMKEVTERMKEVTDYHHNDVGCSFRGVSRQSVMLQE